MGIDRNKVRNDGDVFVTDTAVFTTVFNEIAALLARLATKGNTEDVKALKLIAQRLIVLQSEMSVRHFEMLKSHDEIQNHPDMLLAFAQVQNTFEEESEKLRVMLSE